MAGKQPRAAESNSSQTCVDIEIGNWDIWILLLYLKECRQSVGDSPGVLPKNGGGLHKTGLDRFLIFAIED